MLHIGYLLKRSSGFCIKVDQLKKMLRQCSLTRTSIMKLHQNQYPRRALHNGSPVKSRLVGLMFLNDDLNPSITAHPLFQDSRQTATITTPTISISLTSLRVSHRRSKKLPPQLGGPCTRRTSLYCHLFQIYTRGVAWHRHHGYEDPLGNYDTETTAPSPPFGTSTNSRTPL